jgi:hypothetical protein
MESCLLETLHRQSSFVAVVVVVVEVAVVVVGMVAVAVSQLVEPSLLPGYGWYYYGFVQASSRASHYSWAAWLQVSQSATEEAGFLDWRLL